MHVLGLITIGDHLVPPFATPVGQLGMMYIGFELTFNWFTGLAICYDVYI